MARSSISRLAAPFARLPLFLATVLVTMTLLGVCSRQASATIHYVSTTGSDSNSGTTWTLAKLHVQAGVNAAFSGDQVWVAKGTYTENITAKDGEAVYGGFAGGETSLSQQNVAANPTILDGNSNGTVYTIPSAATGTNTLDGFTVENGTGTTGGDGTVYGGGLLDYPASKNTLVVANCTFTNNEAFNSPDNTNASGGGGIYTQDVTSGITNCTFTSNSASRAGGVEIYLGNPSCHLCEYGIGQDGQADL